MSTSPIVVRIATIEDFERVNAYYANNGSSARVSGDQQVIVAEVGSDLIGVVRLCIENDLLVLRTMRVSGPHQRKGIGTCMLKTLEPLIHRTCFCLPYAHLIGFYGQIGFVEIATNDATFHLRDRLAEYKTRNGAFTIKRR